MDDFISKRTAIDALRAIKYGLWEIDIPSPTVPEYVEHHEQIKNMMEIVDGWIKRIKEEPAVNRWVPCKERLPSYGEAVLTWDGNCYCVEKRIPFIRGEDGEIIVSDWWVSDDFDEEESDYYPNLRDGAAIAWMPLPAPYTEEEEE